MTDANLPSGAADRPPLPTPVAPSPAIPAGSPADPPTERRGVPAGIGALVVGGAAALLVTGALIAMRDPVTPARYVAHEPAAAPAAHRHDPLAARLAACRAVTEDVDGRCQAAWDAHRRRFFGKPNGMKAPAPAPPPASPPASGER